MRRLAALAAALILGACAHGPGPWVGPPPPVWYGTGYAAPYWRPVPRWYGPPPVWRAPPPRAWYRPPPAWRGPPPGWRPHPGLRPGPGWHGGRPGGAWR